MITFKRIYEKIRIQILTGFDIIVEFMDRKYENLNHEEVKSDTTLLYIEEIMKNWREDRIAPTYNELIKVREQQVRLLNNIKNNT